MGDAGAEGCGFRKAGKRRWLAGRAPSNVVLVDMRPHHAEFDRAGFWIEWAVIPTAICDYRSRNSAKPRRPHVMWGILCERVEVPPEDAGSFGVASDETLWEVSLAGGTDGIGAALRRLFVDGGLLDRLLRMCDREHLLQVLEVESLGGLPAGTPPGWP